jgi:hypothetical protein
VQNVVVLRMSAFGKILAITIGVETARKDICCCLNIHQWLNSINHFKRSKSPPFSVSRFLRHVKGFYAAALGIEILCIAAAEIGENSGLYMFGFNPMGIAIAYMMGYALAGFTTFVTILGRYNYSPDQICSCCSVLEQDSKKGFLTNLKTTFKNFVTGIKKLPYLYKQPNLKNILKTSVVILITAESACILTAETVDLLFYNYSILLAAPLALLAGALLEISRCPCCCYCYYYQYCCYFPDWCFTFVL